MKAAAQASIVALIAFVLLPNWGGGVYAQRTDLDFARELFGQEDYIQAITEAKRFIFKNPEDELVEEALIIIADSYAANGDTKKAEAEYSRFLSSYPSSNNVPIVLLKMGKLHANGHDYDKAGKFFLEAVKKSENDSAINRKASYWLFLSNLLSDNQNKPIPETASLSSADIAVIKSFQDKYSKLGFKSPAVAGTLAAIVPGSGHLYLGRNRDAFAAFLLNGLFIWGIAESVNKEETGLVVLLSLFELGWYAGNIYSAVNSAHKHNRHLKDKFKLEFSVDTNLLSSRAYDKKIFFRVNASF